MQSRTLNFGTYALDLSPPALRADGVPVALPPTPLRVLVYLAANPQRTVPRSELLAEVWPDSHVEESALNQALRQIRSCVGDRRQSQQLIKTVRGLGYRFVADFHETPAIPVASDEFVGCRSLMDKLEFQLDAALAGRGNVVLLTGEPGIGKSRVADELAARAIGRHALTVRGVAAPQHGEPSFWPWLQVFRGLAAARPLRGFRDDVEALAPGLLDPESWSRLYADGALPEAAARFQILDLANRCVRRAGELGPIAIFLEDLHDAGEECLELLEFVARDLSQVPVLIVVSYREAEISRKPGHVECLARLTALATVHSLRVEGLDNDDARELIRLRLPDHPPTAVTKLLVERSSGNPLYLIELARYFASHIGKAHSASDWETLIPLGMRALLLQRLVALTPEGSRVLHAAAAIGPVFSTDLLREIKPEADIDGPIEQAIELGLLAAEPGSRHLIRFSHALVREAIYGELKDQPEEYRAFHMRIGEAIEARSPGRVGEIAFHLSEAVPTCEPIRAAECLLRAGDQARSVCANDQAAGAYHKGVGLLEGGTGLLEDRLRCDLLIAFGEVTVIGPRMQEARGALRRAAQLARRHAWPAKFTRAALACARRSEITGVAEPEIIALLEEALSVLEPDAHESRALLLSALSVESRYQPGKLEECLARSREAEALAKLGGSAGAIAQVLEDASLIRWSVPDPEAWRNLNHEIVLYATEANRVELLFNGVKGVATGCLEIGDRYGAEREIAVCENLARESPTPQMKSAVSALRGMKAMLVGEYEAAEACIHEAMSLGVPGGVSLASVQIFAHRLDTGRVAELESATRSLIAGSKGIAGWHFALARVLGELRRFDEMSEAISGAGPLKAIPQDRNWLPALAVLAESVAELRHSPLAEEVHGMLAPYARVNVLHGGGALFYGNTAYFLGLLELSLGELAGATRQLESALSMHERMGAVPFQIRTWYALALVHRARRGTEDLARCRRLAERVLDRSREIGMVALEARAASLLSDLAGDRPD